MHELTKTSLDYAYIATGIFAYPLYSTAAGIGLLIKLTGINGLKTQNDESKLCVDCIQGNYSEYSLERKQFIVQFGLKLVREFKFTPEEYDLGNFSPTRISMNNVIDDLSKQFKKVPVDRFLDSKTHEVLCTVNDSGS